MVNKTLKLIAGLVAVLALGGTAVALNDGNFRIPRDVNRNAAADLTFMGAERTAVKFSTSGQLILSGKGVLHDVEVSTGAATDYVVCTDSATANNTLDSGGGNLFPPLMAGTTNVTALSKVGSPIPREFTNGLNCFSSVATNRFVVLWKKAEDD